MAITNRALLLVDDGEDDVFLMRRALKGAHVENPLFVVDDGQEAIDYLGGIGEFADREKYPLPRVVFLDLKLPLISGHDVLAWIRNREELQCLVVIVLTSSDEVSDINRCYALGANSYLVKPRTPRELEDLAKAFKGYWLEYNCFGDH
jgi:CheY-like chemotaxis protein